jgi:glycosyltransferase involved in cell wall biosynthesis
VLYIVYWGAAEPLGRALVVPSVERLASLGVRLTLVTFDKAADVAEPAVRESIEDRFAALGVRWISLRYHKAPQLPAKIYDIARMCVAGLMARVRETIDIVHARTFVGGLAGLMLAPVLRAKLVYHNEGFYPDEQVDGGVWTYGSGVHRLARGLERRMYASADGIVALSERARTTIAGLPRVAARSTPVIVVPSAVDLERFQVSTFRPDVRGAVRLVYIGSVGLRYLFDRVARFAAVANETLDGARLRVLSRAPGEEIGRVLLGSGLPADSWSVGCVAHPDIPRELNGHHAGLFFLERGLSEHGCSPTKIGEYWACGLPVVTTANVSDTDAIVRRERVGVVVKEHSDLAYREAARELRELLDDPGLTRRCRAAAETYYALGPACERQMALYRSVLSSRSVAPSL